MTSTATVESGGPGGPAAPAQGGATSDGRPVLRRVRFWAAALGVLVIAGVLLSLTAGSPTRPLDTTSTSPQGSRALTRVLAGYGVRLEPESLIADARAARPDVLVVLEPDQYSATQLRVLTRSATRVVFVAPGTPTLRAVSPVEPDAAAELDTEPGCALAGAVAAGEVDLPDDATAYTGGTDQCYGGAVVRDGSLIVLGSVQVLQNAHLADRGVAALDVNLFSDDRGASTVVWLRAGSDADGAGETSIWQLFPDGAYRAFWWLLLVGLLVVLWRARRLGPPVSEPLPVIVRAAELVEGHGRLYRRAAARDRAATALRQATSARLTTRLGLPRGASAQQIGAAAAPHTGWTGAQIHTVLAGPIPSDDAMLVRLALGLDALEAAVRNEERRMR